MKQKHTVLDKYSYIGVGLLFGVGFYIIVTQSQHSMGEKVTLVGVWVIAWFIITVGMLSAVRRIGINSIQLPKKPAAYSIALGSVLIIAGLIIDVGI